MNTQTAVTEVKTSSFEQVIELVTNSLRSANAKRAYAQALTDFMAWRNGAPLLKATVDRYITHLLSQGKSAATINQRLAAIRKLAREAADNGIIEQAHAESIARVSGMSVKGTRTGKWLDRATAQRILTHADTSTLKGLRDRAIMAVLLGAGLRRSVVASLTLAHIQQRDGRWVIVDLVGKGNRVRSVPIPSWTKTAVDAWTTAAGLSEGRVFRAMCKGDTICAADLSAQAIHDIVSEHCDCDPHDLRRTYAKLARTGGAALEQIQLSLGHASIQTTERYLGTQQDLTDAPCDHLGLRFEVTP